MSLSDLFRHYKKGAALKQAALASTIIAGAVGFNMANKALNSNGEVLSESNSSMGRSNSSSASSTGAAGFATSNPALRPAGPPSSSSNSLTSSTGMSSGLAMGSEFDASACIKNPSADTCLKNINLSQADWDKVLPPEGIVAYDHKGNVIFKKCRSLSEGATTAQAEMDSEKARFDKFTNAMNSQASNSRNSDTDVSCAVGPTKAAPKVQPCPTYQNFSELRDYYRAQYYSMSNDLQRAAASDSGCGAIRDIVMGSVDPNWKNDRGIASDLGTAKPSSSNRGTR